VMASAPTRWSEWAARFSGSLIGLVTVMRRAPLTVALVAVLWVVGAATGSLWHGPSAALLAVVGVGPDALAQGRWWTPVTSALWCADLGGYLTASVLLLALAAPAERRVGSGRTALLLLVTQVAGTVIGSGVVRLAWLAGDQWADQISHGLAVGPTAAAVGVGMAFSCRMSTLWRRRIRLFLLLACVLLVAYSGALTDVLRLVAAVTGLLIGPLMLGRSGRPVSHAASRTERRVLVALAVATLALGPVIAAVSDTAIGPLSGLRYLVLVPPPSTDTVQQVCANPATSDDCRALRAQMSLAGLAPTIMTLLPMLLLLISAEGLRRGRRAAWWMALLLNAVLTGLAVLLAAQLFGVPQDQLVAFGGLSRTHSVAAILLPLALPALVAGLLLATRSSFEVGAPRGIYRTLTALLLATILAVSAVFVVGATVLQADFDRPLTLGDLLLALPTRFVPPAYLTEIDPAFLPTRPVATILYEWPGVVVLLVLAAGLALSFRRNRADTYTGDHAHARSLLTANGGSSFSYMTVWPGNSYWLPPTAADTSPTGWSALT